MTRPTPVVWAVVKERDWQQCVSCGRREGLEFQHRRAEGMGGRKAAPLHEEGLTSCWLCNPLYEGAMQRKALRLGWKVRSWVADRGRAADVPVFYATERAWFRLDGPTRVRISSARALEMMRAVYGEEQYEEWRDAA
jgi:hypothetical protein